MQRTAVWFIGAWLAYSLALFSRYLLFAPGRTVFVLIALLAGPVLGYGIFCLAKNWRSSGYKDPSFILAVVVGIASGIASFWLSLPYTHAGSTNHVHGLPFAFAVIADYSVSYGGHLLSFAANFLFYFLLPQVFLRTLAGRPDPA